MDDLPMIAHHAMSTEQLWILGLWFVGLCWFYMWLCMRQPIGHPLLNPLMRY
jgi:hypothetical protein